MEIPTTNHFGIIIEVAGTIDPMDAGMPVSTHTTMHIKTINTSPTVLLIIVNHNAYYLFFQTYGSRFSQCLPIWNRHGHHAHQCSAIIMLSLLMPLVNSSGLSVAPSSWCLESGASHHMTPSSSQFIDSQSYYGKDRIIIGDGSTLNIHQTSTIVVLMNVGNVTISI